jgi:hypothetical protein
VCRAAAGRSGGRVWSCDPRTRQSTPYSPIDAVAGRITALDLVTRCIGWHHEQVRWILVEVAGSGGGEAIVSRLRVGRAFHGRGLSLCEWTALWLGSGADEAGFVGEYDSLHAVSESELVENSRHVCLDRGVRDDELFGDLGVG